MKVVIFKNPFIFWLLAGTCWRNLAILLHFISNSCYLSRSFLQNPFCVCQNHIFEVEKCENLPKIITMPVTIITCKKMEKTGKLDVYSEFMNSSYSQRHGC
jgi:hypothetical protein